MADSDWLEIEPGRAAKLSLRGPNGSLDLIVCYFPTGSDTDEHKRNLTQSLSDHLAPSDAALSVLMGDWNFVMEDDDRFCRHTLQSTNRKDGAISRHFQQFLDSRKLHELDNAAFTHENSIAFTRA